MKVVIVAGGKGTRLRPYTKVLPKPLMPIGNRTILEIIIHQLKNQGFKEIIMLCGYLYELIMLLFEDGSKFGVNIKYIKEEKPLGTVGGLSLIRQELNNAFLMINGDTLTTMDFREVIHAHETNQAVATIALKERRVVVDFGVVGVDSRNEVRSYTEKPNIVNLVSTGVNVLSPKVLEYIELNKYMDFPDLIQKLIDTGEKVKGYIFDGYWLDIGRPDDYEKANTDIREIYGRLGLNANDIIE